MASETLDKVTELTKDIYEDLTATASETRTTTTA